MLSSHPSDGYRNSSRPLLSNSYLEFSQRTLSIDSTPPFSDPGDGCVLAYKFQHEKKSYW